MRVPSTLVVPTYILDKHLAQQHVSIPRGDGMRKLDDDSLSRVRSIIKRMPLDRGLTDAIRSFRSEHGNRPVCVRSSSTIEDLARASAAGVFRSVFQCRSGGEVAKGLRISWASLFERSAIDYATRFCSDLEGYAMAVMLMPMIELTISGVCFSRDPVSGSDEIVIEGGRAHEASRRARQLRARSFPSTRGSCYEGEDGIEAVGGEDARHVLVSCAKELTSHFDRPQDIEWGIDKKGQLWLFQSRDITAIPKCPAFVAPGSGSWRIIDHIQRPGTACFNRLYYGPMEDGWNKDLARVGATFRVRIREVSGFMYFNAIPLTSSEELERAEERARSFWGGGRSSDFLDAWFRSIRPAQQRSLSGLEAEPLASYDDHELISHLKRVFKESLRCVTSHHFHSNLCFAIVGDYLKDATSSDRQFALAPTARHFRFDNDPAIRDAVNAIRRSPRAACLLTNGTTREEQASDSLGTLAALSDDIARGVKNLRSTTGSRLISGYDIVGETYAERPDLILGILHNLAFGSPDTCMRADETQSIDGEHLPNAVERAFQLREERGVFGDLWAIGLLRRAYREIGGRLVERGVIPQVDLALELSIDELVAALRDRSPVSIADLDGRRRYRAAHTVNDAPETLGNGKDLDGNSGSVGPSSTRTDEALMLAYSMAVEKPVCRSPLGKCIFGTPASEGTASGIARLAVTQIDPQSLEPDSIVIGDVATSSFGAIASSVRGMAFELGGVLSHAAILAREFGIPCVVGCAGLLEAVGSGMRVTIDGTKGHVHYSNEGSTAAHEMRRLKCNYDAQLLGRNRFRMLNHKREVRRKLEILSPYPGIRTKHGSGAGGLRRSASRIKPGDKSPRMDSREVEDLTRRLLLEFHPSDRCNLTCPGCTYSRGRSDAESASCFPFDCLEKLFEVFSPKAITIVGGGEPLLYESHSRRIEDLLRTLHALGGGRTKLGLITNGTLLPMDDACWYECIDWIRVSLDAGTPETYAMLKGHDEFDGVLERFFNIVSTTEIPLVGLGYLYSSVNIRNAIDLVERIANRMFMDYKKHLGRVNIQFRPWRSPGVDAKITDRVLTDGQINALSIGLLERTVDHHRLKTFVKENTNLAVNVLSGGARRGTRPFSQCYVGLAKIVVRADGSLYPCFRVAALEDERFVCGNVITDTARSIAEKMKGVFLNQIPSLCFREHERCLFCNFNNLMEDHIHGDQAPADVPECDFFF